MTKIWAIHSGGDWHDASAEYLVLPDGMNLEDEKKLWEKWYRDEYCRALRKGARPEFVSFTGQLRAKGATDPSKDQLEVFSDD